MIISCINCKKNFDINSDLIPEKGRLLQCGVCNHKWVFQNIIIPIEKEKLIYSNQVVDSEITKKKKTIDIEIMKENISDDNKVAIPKDTETIINEAESILNNKNKNGKKSYILNVIFVFIISFSALLILIDTFKYPLSKIIPNIEFILYNLYETLTDIGLFFKDLI